MMTLPNLQRMQVRVSVHESVLDQVVKGLYATIVVDVYRDRPHKATVQSVAVLPSQEDWNSSETKVYETIVTLDEEGTRVVAGFGNCLPPPATGPRRSGSWNSARPFPCRTSWPCTRS